MALVLLMKHLPNLAHAGGILRLFVLRSKGNDPREPQGESGLIAGLAGCVTWTRRDLVSQDFHHNLWLKPHVGDQN